MAAIYMCPQCGKPVLRGRRDNRLPAKRVHAYCQASERNTYLRLLDSRPLLRNVMSLWDRADIGPHTEAR